MPANHRDDAPDEEEPIMEDILMAGDVLEEIPEGNDLRLTEEFEQQWHQRSKKMRGSDRAIRWFAAARDVAREDIEATTDGELFVLEVDGSVIGRWPSKTAFLAETVLRPTLREWIPESEWDQLSEDLQRELPARLLLFLERCPSCDGDLVFEEEVDDGAVQVSLACGACEATLFSGTRE